MTGYSTTETTMRTFFDEVRAHLAKDRLAQVLLHRNDRVEKGDGSYVTKGDLLVQEWVIGLVERCFQDAELISEEMVATGKLPDENKPLIVLDPIDGTENFTSGLPIWGISICCFYKGKHLGSLIGCPELDLWVQSDEPLVRYQSRIRGLSSSLNKEQLLRATEGFEYRMFGCCVFNMISVLRGSFLSFENPKGAETWDILAGFNLALEHGLSVEVDGAPYRGQYLPPDRKYRFKVG